MTAWPPARRIHSLLRPANTGSRFGPGELRWPQTLHQLPGRALYYTLLGSARLVTCLGGRPAALQTMWNAQELYGPLIDLPFASGRFCILDNDVTDRRGLVD